MVILRPRLGLMSGVMAILRPRLGLMRVWVMVILRPRLGLMSGVMVILRPRLGLRMRVWVMAILRPRLGLMSAPRAAMFGVLRGEGAVMLCYNSTYTFSITNSPCTCIRHPAP